MWTALIDQCSLLDAFSNTNAHLSKLAVFYYCINFTSCVYHLNIVCSMPAFADFYGSLCYNLCQLLVSRIIILCWHTSCQEKRCQFVFNNNSCICWSTFAPLETGMNTLHLVVIYFLNGLMISNLWDIARHESLLDRITC